MSYSPTLMRWAQQEPFGSEYVDGPDLYVALRNNPLKYVDPSGLQAATTTAPAESEGIKVYEVPDANFLDKMGGTPAGTSVTGGWIVVVYSKCKFVDLKPRLTIVTAHAMAESIVEQSLKPITQQAAQAIIDNALDFERKNWQAGLKNAWIKEMGTLRGNLSKINAGSDEEFRKLANEQINKTGQALSAAWQELENADFARRKVHPEAPALRPTLGETYWQKVKANVFIFTEDQFQKFEPMLQTLDTPPATTAPAR